MYASRDRVSDNLRGLRRHDVPVLENNMRLMEERQGLATETKEIECFKAILVKMEAMKEHACTQHKLFSFHLIQDEGLEGQLLTEGELAEMNKSVIWLRSICSMTQEQWESHIVDVKELMGCLQLDEGDEECCVCHSDMLVCRHSPEARHDVACAVLPFDCRHPLCHDCATNHRIEKCPVPYCRARRV